MSQMERRRPRSFFSRGGTGRHVAGLLGDALMQMGGLKPHYMPMMEQRTPWEPPGLLDAQGRQKEWELWHRRRPDMQGKVADSWYRRS